MGGVFTLHVSYFFCMKKFKKITKKNTCFIFLLDYYTPFSCYDMSYSWSRKCNNFNDAPWFNLGFIVVDDYYLAHVMLLPRLNWFRNEKLYNKGEFSLALGSIPLFINCVITCNAYLISWNCDWSWTSTLILLHFVIII